VGEKTTGTGKEARLLLKKKGASKRKKIGLGGGNWVIMGYGRRNKRLQRKTLFGGKKGKAEVPQGPVKKGSKKNMHGQLGASANFRNTTHV